jgi:excinuclease ABC subunit C
MRDCAKQVIYVGKAKNLRSRVRSYFNNSDERRQISYLVEKISFLDTVVTKDERQAILLEADLIRKYKPRYNIRLKDDKSHLLIRIDESVEWPRLHVVRREEDDGARYYGPYMHSYELRSLLETIKRVVPLRTCSDAVFRNRMRPCLEYQIKRCAGPCCLPVAREDYREWLRQAKDIIRGKSEQVVLSLKREMDVASEEMRFEDAATLRDRIEILERLGQDETEVRYGEASCDVFGVYLEGSAVEMALVSVRRGRLGEVKTFGFSDVISSKEEALSTLISQYYANQSDIPPAIFVPFEFESSEALSEVLSERNGRMVSITVPKQGSKRKLIELSEENAKQSYHARYSSGTRQDRALRELVHHLKLRQLPRIIECVDISHFQGDSTVGVVVSFKDGTPEKDRYRKFIVAQQGKPDDFASIYEVVKRHLKRCLEADQLPDLLVIDGGAQQLAKAVAAAEELEVSGLEIVALAKRRASPGASGQRRPERVFLPKVKSPIIMPGDNTGLLLLQRARDEAHRFAISFHRKRRSKKVFPGNTR